MFRKLIHIATIVTLIILNDLSSQTPNVECNRCDISTYTDSIHLHNVRFESNEALIIADSLLKVYGNHICPNVIRIKASRAYAYEHLYKYDTAIEIYNEILEIAKRKNYKDQEIDINTSLARVYEILQRPEICREYLNINEKLLQLHENKALLSHHYVREASYQRIFGEKEKAIEFAKKAILMGEESGRIGSLAGGNLILGLMTEDFEKSIQYLKESSHYCYEEGDYIGYLFQEMNIASRHLRNGDQTAALDILIPLREEIESLTQNDKNYYQTRSYHSTLKARAYEAAGKKDSQIVALKEVNKYSSLSGDLANQEKINQLILDNTISQEKAKVVIVKNQNKLLYISLFILFAVLLGLLRLYLNNLKNNKKIEEQSRTISKQYKEKEKLYNYQSTLLSEVHHRIKNNLQLIISLLALQKAKTGTGEIVSILDMLSYRISSISLIHEQLYNLKEFEKIDVTIYAKDLIRNFSTLSSRKDITFDFDITDLQFNLETMTPLGLIWSELISNSLKYNKTKKELLIFFSLKNDEDIYTMHYFDNGSGYPEGKFTATVSGMGFSIINSLSRQLFAKTSTYNNNGAHYTMTFKEKTISPL